MSAEATGGAGAAPEHEGGVLFSASAKHLWVFGYGSLMWRPGFPYLEAVHARLIGYRRCFCIYSIHHRGTPSRPGMVLGLDRGGSCEASPSASRPTWPTRRSGICASAAGDRASIARRTCRSR